MTPHWHLVKLAGQVKREDKVVLKSLFKTHGLVGSFAPLVILFKESSYGVGTHDSGESKWMCLTNIVHKTISFRQMNSQSNF